MNLARYTKVHKKKKPWWIQALQIFFFVLFGGIIFYIVLEIYRNQLFDIIVKALVLDTRFLLLLLVNVFLICAVLMVLLYQWMDRENIRFKFLRRRYRSMLVSPEYYRNLRRVNIDNFFPGAIAAAPQGKLDVDHELKSSSLVVIDQTGVHKNARQTYIAYKNGKLHGNFLTYFVNGNLLAEIMYKDGLLDGRSVVYYPNGFLHNEKYFKNGKLNGVFRAWDEEGALFFEIEYQDDIQHGFDRTYRKNGIIEYEDTYIHGVLVKRKTFDGLGQFKYVQKYRKE